MRTLRKLAPWIFMVVLLATAGWWTGYANRLFRYDSVSFSNDAGQEVQFTDARLWHDFRGQWQVSGREGADTFPRSKAVVMRGASIAPSVGYISVLLLSVAVFVAAFRWSNPRQVRRTVAPL